MTYNPIDWGVSWFGVNPIRYSGLCQRCYQPKPIHIGYEGGQYTGVFMCASCGPIAIMETRSAIKLRKEN